MENQKEPVIIPPIEQIREELAREEARYGFRKTVRNIAVALLVAAANATLIATRMLGLVRVNGNSMNPTLAEDEIVIIRQTKEFEKGDIIGFYYGGRILLKRVIACEGDVVEIDGGGAVSVNGEEIDEPYLKEKNLGKCDVEFPYEVPEEMTFVLGDNRTISIDSRIKSIGCVDRDQIVGKAIFRAWPAGRMEILR